MADSEILCFHCAQPVGDPPQLNELEDGEACPACRDRLLEELPPIVHSPVRAVEPKAGEASETGTGSSEEGEDEEAWPRLVRDVDDEAHGSTEPEAGSAD